MDIFVAGFLGLLQGLTEFLPVSSSGHLVIAQALLPHFDSPGVLFEVILHLGTLLSIVVYFLREEKNLKKYYSFRYLTTLVIGTIPAVVVGFFFQDFFEGIFESVLAVAGFLFVTGIVTFLTDKAPAGKTSEVSEKNALLVGIAQSVAIFPGVSRSGSTIFSGSWLGIKREDVAKFSFLLSIPAILGANALEIVKYSGEGEINIVLYVVGFVCAFIAGTFAIKTLMKLLKTNKFKYFSYYCFALGTLLLFLY